MTRDGRRAYAYNTPANMTETATMNGVAYAYRYDGDGMRVQRLGGGSLRFYEHRAGAQVLTEYQENCGGSGSFASVSPPANGCSHRRIRLQQDGPPSCLSGGGSGGATIGPGSGM